MPRAKPKGVRGPPKTASGGKARAKYMTTRIKKYVKKR